MLPAMEWVHAAVKTTRGEASHLNSTVINCRQEYQTSSSAGISDRRKIGRTTWFPGLDGSTLNLSQKMAQSWSSWTALYGPSPTKPGCCISQANHSGFISVTPTTSRWENIAFTSAGSLSLYFRSFLAFVINLSPLPPPPKFMLAQRRTSGGAGSTCVGATLSGGAGSTCVGATLLDEACMVDARSSDCKKKKQSNNFLGRKNYGVSMRDVANANP